MVSESFRKIKGASLVKRGRVLLPSSFLLLGPGEPIYEWDLSRPGLLSHPSKPVFPGESEGKGLIWWGILAQPSLKELRSASTNPAFHKGTPGPCVGKGLDEGQRE